MFGDFMIWAEEFNKQFFCKHRYKFLSATNGEYQLYECEKCGRMKTR